MIRTTSEIRQAALRQEKLFHLESQAVCALAGSIGAQYGITAKEGGYWYWDEDGRQKRHEVNCLLEGTVSFWAYLNSAKFRDDIALLEKFIRCLAKDAGHATGKEYAEVASYFEKGVYVNKQVSVAACLYDRSVDAGYHPAVVSLLKLRCTDTWHLYKEKYANWDNIYNCYKEVVDKGFTEEDLNEIDPAIVHVIKVEQKAEQDDTEAIREIARHYYHHSDDKYAYSKYMHRLAKKGEADGILYKSRYQFEKKGNIAKKALSLNWHLRGADLGDAECMYRAGRIYELLVEKIPWTIKNAIYFHEMAAQKGILESMRRLARIYAQEGTAYYDKNKAEYYRDKLMEFGG